MIYFRHKLGALLDAEGDFGYFPDRFNILEEYVSEIEPDAPRISFHKLNAIGTTRMDIVLIPYEKGKLERFDGSRFRFLKWLMNTKPKHIIFFNLLNRDITLVDRNKMPIFWLRRLCISWLTRRLTKAN